MSNLLVDCICRTAKEAVARNIKRTILLTSSEGVGNARRAVASVLPLGSTCEGGVWITPSGHIVSIKRYEDVAPAYPDPVFFKVCNGGDALSSEDRVHVQRWRNIVSTLAP